MATMTPDAAKKIIMAGPSKRFNNGKLLRVVIVVIVVYVAPATGRPVRSSEDRYHGSYTCMHGTSNEVVT